MISLERVLKSLQDESIPGVMKSFTRVVPNFEIRPDS
jgi:hypothetical protein